MIVRHFTVCALSFALGAACLAQDSTPATSAGQAPAAGQGPRDGQNGQEKRRGPGGMGQGGMGAGGMMGRGISGTVTEVAADHFMVKNGANEIYTVHFSANTRMMKQGPTAPGSAAPGSSAPGSSAPGSAQDRPMGGGSPPVAIKASEIKVGDAIGAGGEIDEAAKSIGAVFVMLLDPERARQMREWQANFGKTWLMGRVTAISEVKVTLHSAVDNADHSFVADENTTFRKRRDPITLADMQLGDNIRVDGAVKGGHFTAATVVVMAPPATGGPMKPAGEAPK